MNKYELLFEEIVEKTMAGELQWAQIRRTANADLIFDPIHVFRQFEATLTRAGTTFKLLLVEKKFEDDGWGLMRNAYRPEILVLSAEGELMATLTDVMVKKSRMVTLADVILSRSNSSAKLFDALAEAATVKP